MSKKTILIIIILIIAVGAVGYVLLSKSKPCAMLYVGYKNTETGQCEIFSGCSVPQKYILDEVCVNQVLEKEMPGIVGECKFSEENCKNGKTEFCNQTLTKFPGTKYEKKFVCSEILQNNIVDWKTYQNEQYGFLVKYPPTLKVWENQQSGKAVYGVSFENPLANQTTAGRKMVFSVFVFNDTTQLQDAFSANSDLYRIRTDQGRVVINGHQSQKILFKPKSPNDVEATVYLIADKSIAVMFFGTDYHKISEADMNQILSSFRFTK